MNGPQINVTISNPDFKGDYCKNCSRPIYQTTVGEKKEPQWVHVFTGCFYCNSIFHEKSTGAEPKEKDFATDHLPEGSH